MPAQGLQIPQRLSALEDPERVGAPGNKRGVLDVGGGELEEEARGGATPVVLAGRVEKAGPVAQPPSSNPLALENFLDHDCLVMGSIASAEDQRQRTPAYG
jgi:hypothetical protein